jgi:hypothetical protein
VSRKRTKPAAPRNVYFLAGGEQEARDRAEKIMRAIDERGPALEVLIRTLFSAVEDVTRSLKDGELLSLALLAGVGPLGQPELEARPAIAAWLRECLRSLEVHSPEVELRNGRGRRPDDPRVPAMVSEAAMDIEHFDAMRALGYGKVPSDRQTLDRAITRALPKRADRGPLRPRREALRKAVYRRRTAKVRAPGAQN